MYDIETPGATLQLGKQDEGFVKTIDFDITGATGTPTLVHKRSESDDPYFGITEVSGTTLTWTITKYDTALGGYGVAEIRFDNGDATAKSVLYKTYTIPSISTTTPSGQPEVPDWVQRVLDAAEEVRGLIPTTGTVGYFLRKTATGTEWAYVGGGGTPDHNQLSNRDAANQHPISAITGLAETIEQQSDKISELIGLEEVEWVDGAYIRTNVNIGEIVNTTPTISNLYSYSRVDCSEGDIFNVKSVYSASGARGWAFLDSDNVLLAISEPNVTISDTKIVAPQYTASVIFNNNNDNVPNKEIINEKDRIEVLRDKVSNVENSAVYKTAGVNVYDVTKAQSGFITNSSGEIADSDSYVTSDYIAVEEGQSITVTGTARKFLAFDAVKTSIVSTYQENSITDYTFVATTDGYVRYSFNLANKDTAVVSYTSTPVEKYYPYGLQIEEGIDLSQFQYGNIEALIKSQNVLYGKKWVACGDSFTEGDFSDSLTNDYIFQDGLYKGKNKVYPYFIGRRNNMTVINEAKGGTSIAHTTTRENAFVDGRYMDIPSDADYITLKFGINDGGYNVPIGTIDDEVNDTFYGAWNIVMEYLIENHPYAKIGIIVGNGMQNKVEYPNAIKAIAKKWGISYLDEAFGETVPLLHRTNKDYVCEEAKSMRFNSFVVNQSTNWHPNEKAHEYESTFIEAWLRTL